MLPEGESLPAFDMFVVVILCPRRRLRFLFSFFGGRHFVTKWVPFIRSGPHFEEMLSKGSSTCFEFQILLKPTKIWFEKVVVSNLRPNYGNMFDPSLCPVLKSLKKGIYVLGGPQSYGWKSIC